MSLSVKKSAVALLLIVLTLQGAAPASAEVTHVDHDEIKMVSTKKADFGNSTHMWGQPTRPAEIDWYSSTHLVGRRNGARFELVPVESMTVKIYGLLYWDALHEGCADLQVTYWDTGTRPRQLGSETVRKCGPGWNAGSTDNYQVVELSFRHPDVDMVNLTTSSPGGRAESVTVRLGDTATSQ